MKVASVWLVLMAAVASGVILTSAPGATAGPERASQPTSETPPATSVISATETVTATGTATATVTATSTPVITAAPVPVFLPIAIREPRCEPVSQHIDVAVVLDGSKYMEKMRGGQPAWDAGLGMVRTLLDTMDFDPAGGQDQFAMTVFRHRNDILPEESLGLTRTAHDAREFLDELELGTPRDTARMDVGVSHGHALLNSGRHMPANARVLIVISELQPKNVPYEDVPGCEEADENCTMLKRADEVKADGVVFVVFATGQDNRGPELNAMATDPSLALVLPDANAIRATYARLAPQTPCPPDQFWPRTGR